jgi:putative NADH-flavin reductase
VKLLVIGASRGTGRLVVEEAGSRGHAITALVRERSRLADFRDVVVIEGDARDAAAVARAVAGKDAVITTLGPGARSPAKLCSEATAVLTEAMRGAGVRRLIMVTGAMIGHPRERLGLVYRLMLALYPRPLKDLIQDRRDSERVVRESGLDWTLVHPPMLVDGPPLGSIRAGEDLRLSSFSRIRRADLARFLLDEAEAGAWRRRAVAVAGR